MNANEVKEIIEKEIAGRRVASNWHDVDVRACLVEPRKISAQNTFPHPGRPEPKTLDLWLVLEELPGENDGYLILFDQDLHEFGLGIWGKGGGIVFIGYYGSFLSTLQGM